MIQPNVYEDTISSPLMTIGISIAITRTWTCKHKHDVVSGGGESYMYIKMVKSVLLTTNSKTFSVCFILLFFLKKRHKFMCGSNLQ